MNMNLDDLINGYRTTPIKEIGKINSILQRKDYVWSNHVLFLELFRKSYLYSQYAKYETTFERFYKNVILENDSLDGLDDNEKALIQYRSYCELIFNLLTVDVEDIKPYRSAFSDDIKQLIELINNGLLLCGYKVVTKDKHFITEKIDIVAEAVSAIDKAYQEDIMDYLSAKTVKEKDQALTSLSIKLNAMEPNNNYVKQNKKYVQFLRHREEKKYEDVSSWFFNKEDYSINLDKLFKIFVFMIAYNNCSNIINEFDSRSRGDK